MVSRIVRQAWNQGRVGVAAIVRAGPRPLGPDAGPGRSPPAPGMATLEIKINAKSKTAKAQVLLSKKSVVFLTPPICCEPPPPKVDANPPPLGF